MSSSTDIVKNLDRRVFALESERSDDMAGTAIEQITKMYAGLEIDVKFTAYHHRYHRCGEQMRSVAATGVESNPAIYTIRTSPHLLL